MFCFQNTRNTFQSIGTTTSNWNFNSLPLNELEGFRFSFALRISNQFSKQWNEKPLLTIFAIKLRNEKYSFLKVIGIIALNHRWYFHCFRCPILPDSSFAAKFFFFWYSQCQRPNSFQMPHFDIFFSSLISRRFRSHGLYITFLWLLLKFQFSNF